MIPTIARPLRSNPRPSGKPLERLLSPAHRLHRAEAPGVNENCWTESEISRLIARDKVDGLHWEERSLVR